MMTEEELRKAEQECSPNDTEELWRISQAREELELYKFCKNCLLFLYGVLIAVAVVATFVYLLMRI